MDFNEADSVHDIIQEILVIDENKTKRYDTSDFESIFYSLIDDWIRKVK